MAYRPHPQHRSAAFATQKSQWTIGVQEETACYQVATVKAWTNRGFYWGLHLNGAIPAQLGTAPLPASDDLKIAKFVGEDGGDWHGYPVAHWLSPYDKPGEAVLASWLQNGYINRPTMSKIHRGKKCAL